MIERELHDHSIYRNKNSEVYYYPEEAIKTKSYTEYTKPFQQENNGRGLLFLSRNIITDTTNGRPRSVSRTTYSIHKFGRVRSNYHWRNLSLSTETPTYKCINVWIMSLYNHQKSICTPPTYIIKSISEMYHYRSQFTWCKTIWRWPGK